MIQNMKPDRIQFGPPIDDDLPWTEKTPSLTRSFDFAEVREAAHFLIYADEVAAESDEIRVNQNLIGRNLTITVKPLSADYLPQAVYEFAARIDAAVKDLRQPGLDLDDFDLEDFGDDDFDLDDLDLDDLDDLDDLEGDEDDDLVH
ncbi:MAG TPA: hypothetical protein VGG06_02975 [Thermoanaerobaculia bacterium]